MAGALAYDNCGRVILTDAGVLGGCAMLSRAGGILLLIAASAAAGTLPPSAATHGVLLEKTSIRMKDGTRLAVTLYMPDDLKAGERCPALLEYLPYRKDDDEASRDYETHTYFARRGYVSARVDIRGFGASEGTPPDREYSAREQQDAEQVIAWLARQRWSNGKVGMLGISWGGFNSIQMALRRPPALKAILAVAATEELFKEDVHYMDGVFHVDEFELTMDLDQGRPGAPDFSLEESVIGPRMDSPPWSLNYMKHQRDGAFWRAAAAADRDPGRARVFDRRTAGRVPRQHSADAGKVEGAAQGLDRSVEPRVSQRQRLWAAVRMAGPGSALVRLLAQGPQHRHARASRKWSFISSIGICRGSQLAGRARRMARRNLAAGGPNADDVVSAARSSPGR